MSLSDIRERFITASGRRDLITGSGADNGANFYIGAGVRLLDLYGTHSKRRAWYRKDIAAGDIKLAFRHCLAIEQVWLSNADGRNMLTKKGLGWLRENYQDTGSSSAFAQCLNTDGHVLTTVNLAGGRTRRVCTVGGHSYYSTLELSAPTYYCPLVGGLAPDQSTLTEDNYTDEFTYESEDIIFKSGTTEHYAYNGILFYPPSDGIYTISVLGIFMSKPLVNDDDANFWSEVYPEQLVQAAMAVLEGFYRNTEGRKDWAAVVDDILGGIDSLEAEQDAAGISQMEG